MPSLAVSGDCPGQVHNSGLPWRRCCKVDFWRRLSRDAAARAIFGTVRDARYSHPSSVGDLGIREETEHHREYEDL